MKIVQLLPSLDVGGMERMALHLACQQQRTGHQARIYCTSHPGELAAQAEAAGTPVIAFGKKPGFSIGLVHQLARHLRADRPDVLHTHNALVHHYGVLAARLAGVPVVVNTRHGFAALNWDDRRETALRTRRRENIFRRTLRWTDAVVLVSGAVQQEFVETMGVPRELTRVVLNGIDIDGFTPSQAQPGSRRPGFRFGTVGRLAPSKRHELLVRAFALLAGKLPAAELHILGDGPCKTDIEAAITALGLEGRVVLRGYSSEVARFLVTLDTFVLSSISEGLPVAVLEAMAAGLPIVSTRLPGVEEVAPEGRIAWYVPPDDPAALAGGMRAAFDSGRLPAMGEAARAAVQGYGIAQTWQAYERIFSELLAAKRRHTAAAA